MIDYINKWKKKNIIFYIYLLIAEQHYFQVYFV